MLYVKLIIIIPINWNSLLHLIHLVVSSTLQGSIHQTIEYTKNATEPEERHCKNTPYCSIVTSDSPGITLSCRQGNSKQHRYLEQLKVLSVVAAALFFDYDNYKLEKGGKTEKVKLRVLAVTHINSTLKTFLY